MDKVRAEVEEMVIPTYESAPYEEVPMFAFNRIHQGTTGNPFPHKVVNKVRRDSKVDKKYTAVHLENEYLDVIIIPELGGRIFAARDKSNGYDFLYRHHVIKPALIGIYGLWISGGMEFNWPRHHRPSTFMPTDFMVERLPEGGAIVWMSEHDPLFRMKGMVGVAMYPGRALFETKMRIFNRTELPHIFHWWENAAVPVNEDFQVFFPPDVTCVNYHSYRASGAYPVMDEYFYVQDNRGGRDIRFHKNSEMAVSYFSGPTKYDYFGGYDHGKKAGLIHYSSHHTSPGKKMFTWGYRNRAKAWEGALTDSDGPYVELMASSYGDNQPGFSWIEPFERKEFSQTWYPYKEIGEPLAATDRALIRYEREGNDLAVYVYATGDFPRAALEIRANGAAPLVKNEDLRAASPKKILFPAPGDAIKDGLSVTLRDQNGAVLLAYVKETPAPYVPVPLDDIPAPDAFDKAGDLCAAGTHIDQYYDPVIGPDAYWERGLSLDPNHSGCLVNLARYCIARQDYDKAQELLDRAVKSVTRYNPNPRDSEALYLLGLALIHGKDYAGALEALHKARWTYTQIVPASCIIAQLYSRAGEYGKAEDLLEETIRQHGRNQRAVELLITVLRKQGKTKAALEEARRLLAEDPLDLHVLNELRLLGDESPGEERFKYRRSETGMDLAADYAAMGLFDDALDLLKWIEAREEPVSLMLYARGYLESLMGNREAAKACITRAGKAAWGMRFASSLFEAAALREAIKLCPEDARAHNELGTLAYGIKHKTTEAVSEWKTALALAPDSVLALRNLAVGLFSKNNSDPEVLTLLEEAVQKKPDDLQLIYERNLVMELQNVPPEQLLRTWENMRVAPDAWDAIYLQGIHIYYQLGMWDKALGMIREHDFIPAESGEAPLGFEYGGILATMAYDSLKKGKTEEALKLFREAGNSPLNIGGGVFHAVNFCPYKYGEALCLFKMGKESEARTVLAWIDNFPENYFTLGLQPSFPYYKGMALIGLGRAAEGREYLERLRKRAERELALKEEGYFSGTADYNSYIRNPGEQRRIHYACLLALALNGLGEKKKAIAALDQALGLDPGNMQANLVKMEIT
jgi:tetratricopeptide (TPR) repeat protein